MSQICITKFGSKIKSARIKNLFKRFNLGRLNNVLILNHQKIAANIIWNNNLPAKEIYSKLKLSDSSVYIYDKKSLWNIYLKKDKIHTSISNDNTINNYQNSYSKYSNSWLRNAYM